MGISYNPLWEMLKEKGISKMEFAKNVSDKVIFMADGVIEEYGEPQKLFENPESDKLKTFLNNALDI